MSELLERLSANTARRRSLLRLEELQEPEERLELEGLEERP